MKKLGLINVCYEKTLLHVYNSQNGYKMFNIITVAHFTQSISKLLVNQYPINDKHTCVSKNSLVDN